MKARIESLNIYYYPDVIVTCDRRDRETPAFKRYPSLITEVLSKSTEAFERGDKFDDHTNCVAQYYAMYFTSRNDNYKFIHIYRIEHKNDVVVS